MHKKTPAKTAMEETIIIIIIIIMIIILIIALQSYVF